MTATGPDINSKRYVTLTPDTPIRIHSEYSLFTPPMNRADSLRLRNSLHENGFIGDPIIVSHDDDGIYTIIDGRNRFDACKKLGMNCPAKVVEWTPTQTRIEVWARNIVRRHLTIRNLVECYIAEDPELQAEEIRAMTGGALNTVRNYRRSALKRIEPLREALRSGGTYEAVAKASRKLDEEEEEQNARDHAENAKPRNIWQPSPALDPHLRDGFTAWAATRRSLGKKELTRIKNLLTVISENTLAGRTVELVIDGKPIR